MTERDVAAAMARLYDALWRQPVPDVRQTRKSVLNQDVRVVCDALEQAQRSLAECYRLSGADPDGNEDWRLACDAVAEVRRLRREYDEMQAKADREWCRAENADAKGILCEEAQLAAEAKLAEAQQEIERLTDKLMIANSLRFGSWTVAKYD